MAKKENMLRSATRLRSAAPESWGDFMVDLRAYAQEIANELVRSPPESLVIQQGRAQAVVDLAESLANAHIEVDRFDARKTQPARNRNEYGAHNWSL